MIVSGEDGIEASDTGQIVVETGIVFVVTDPTGQFVTVAGHLVIVSTRVVYTVEVVYSSGEDVGELGVVSVSVTGQIVVETAIVLVVTEPTGQFVTVAGHFVIVSTRVVYTVDVVNS